MPPRATARASGPSRPARSSGCVRGTRCSSGRRRTPSGSSAGSSTSSANCLDRHLAGPLRNKAAIIWEGEPGDRRVLTYWDLAREVRRAANALKRLGVRKGDRVAIYLPMVPEAAIAMLACARIGAVHSVIFGGILRGVGARPGQRRRGQGAHHRRRRLPPRPGRAAQAHGRSGDGRNAVDRALRRGPAQRRSGYRTGGDESFATMTEGRDHWWHQLLDDVTSRLPA